MIKKEFLLDPAMVFLNHGSFGACPTSVFEAYQGFQRELERQPVEFPALERRFPELLAAARVPRSYFFASRARGPAAAPRPRA